MGRGDGKVGEVVEVVDAVEELEVEGGGGLAVDLGRVSRGHGVLFFFFYFELFMSMAFSMLKIEEYFNW